MIQIKKNVITANENDFEYAIKGTKSPAVLLINGAGGPIEGWSRIWDKIGDENIVFAYNRPGIGKSSKHTVAQTGNNMVKDLRALLMSLNLEPPYLIVGHSLGGLIANLFARVYPDDVRGIIFIESSTIKDVLANSKRKKVTDINELAEVDNVLTTTKQIEESGAFPSIPITVIAGTKPAFSWIMPRKLKESRLNNQKELLSLSGKGKITLARKSGHFPQFTEPNLVINEINNLLQEMCGEEQIKLDK